VQRIHDHDGRAPGEGGLELWLQLGEAVGLSRAELESLAFVVPGAKRACDAYVELVASHDLLTSVASSLTELAAGDIMHVRIAAFEKHYAWVEPRGLAYFRSRTLQAPRDARGGLAYVLAHASTREDQDRCLRALTRKCEILWSLLDAVERAGARPVLARAAERRFDEREGKAIVVLPERLIKLDGSSAAILDRCDGSRSANAVAMELAAQHPATPHVFEDVCDFIEQMEKLGVLTRASG
jgi:coenzyme PQQ biosynthesis protein PqqD